MLSIYGTLYIFLYVIYSSIRVNTLSVLRILTLTFKYIFVIILYIDNVWDVLYILVYRQLFIFPGGKRVVSQYRYTVLCVIVLIYYFSKIIRTIRTYGILSSHAIIYRYFFMSVCSLSEIFNIQGSLPHVILYLNRLDIAWSLLLISVRVPFSVVIL